jgi:hypothetical protein
MPARSRLLALLLPLPVAAAIACGSSDGSTGLGGGGSLVNGSFSAKIDGATFTATAATVVSSSGIVSVGAGNASGRTLGFAWVDGGTGTYPVGSGNATVGTHTYQSHTWSASAIQGSGTITITTKTATRVAGTFSFVLQPDAASGATGTRTITNGVFDLTYP